VEKLMPCAANAVRRAEREKIVRFGKRILCICNCRVHTPSAGVQTRVFLGLLSKPVFLRARDRHQQDNKGETSPEKAIHAQHLRSK
jgi:hypothetical protein